MVQKYSVHSILCISTIILKEIPLKLGCPWGAVFYVQQVGVLITLFDTLCYTCSLEYERTALYFITLL